MKYKFLLILGLMLVSGCTNTNFYFNLPESYNQPIDIEEISMNSSVGLDRTKK